MKFLFALLMLFSSASALAEVAYCVEMTPKYDVPLPWGGSTRFFKLESDPVMVIGQSYRDLRSQCPSDHYLLQSYRIETVAEDIDAGDFIIAAGDYVKDAVLYPRDTGVAVSPSLQAPPPPAELEQRR